MTLLEKVFCSPYWQDLCCQELETPAGRKVRVDLSLYPPGGRDRTAMCRCEVCAKWTPPDFPSTFCCDCRTETEEEAFEQRLRHIHDNDDDELVRALVRLRWARPYIRPQHEDDDKRPDETAFLPDHFRERQDDSMSSMEALTFFEQQGTSGRHWLAEALDAPDKPVPRRSAGAVVRAIRRHLTWVGKDTPRRAIGCSVILLPDKDDALREEIACYETTGEIMLRARLRNRVNPRLRYRRSASRT